MQKNLIYKLIIMYEGGAYAGWQRQPHSLSIQEIIEMKLQILLQKKTHLIGAGRTDAGVHAQGQVAHISVDEIIIDEYKFLYSLNGMLPPDIRIIAFHQVSSEFHARYSAIGKEYRYTIVNNSFLSPFDRRYSWHIHKKLDIDCLYQAAQLFEGTHDFFSFANSNIQGAAAKNSVRTIYSLRVKSTDDLKIDFTFYGNGFLYKMIRNIVGMLVSVAHKKKTTQDIQYALSHRNRKHADRAAPPQGLTLLRIEYPNIFV